MVVSVRSGVYNIDVDLNNYFLLVFAGSQLETNKKAMSIQVYIIP
jgi:hypothetical protein